MDFDSIKASRIVVRFLHFFAIWPNQGSSLDTPWIRRCNRYWPYLIHGVMTFMFTVLMWVEAFVTNDFERRAEVLFIMLTMTSLLAKIVNNWRRHHIARELLEEWSTSQQFKVNFGQERDIWELAHRRFALVTYVYIFCSAGSGVCILMSSLLNYPNKLPFWMWVPYDWTQPVNFWCTFAFQVIAVPFSCLSNVGMDLLNCYLMLHISLCLELVGMRMAALAPTGNSLESEQQLLAQFVAIIALHRRIKMHTNRIQMFISSSTLIQILLSSIIICLTIYCLQMRTTLQDPFFFLMKSQYLFAMTWQIFLPCMYGNQIIDKANQLVNDLYTCQWPDMSVKMRRQIFTFMIYLNRPMELQAGSFFVIGLVLFGKIMNQAYSLLALLLNVDDE
ncbi:putative odorant receptor 71a [Drosophila grimshawi]|uniref:putative odorant receptor 71a n=1 Tax=Drosophila grimshawi TaxID=7222 RepID=UPI0013EF5ACA|nr:putative odorant receptor 71a [Drosophila grimshawi]